MSKQWKVNKLTLVPAVVILLNHVLLRNVCCNPSRSSKMARCSLNMDLDVCFTSGPPRHLNVSCNEAEVCKKPFTITYMKVEPYTVEIIKDLLKVCCGPCVKINSIVNLEKVAQIEPASNDSADFIFPVLGRADEKFLYDHYFIPLIKAPSIYYITHKPHDVMHELLSSCINMWPLMIISLLMVVVSGFLGWLMETWSNKESFPRAFLIGWFEGFWWSFISMTTVGYGDKVPKSVAARLFSIFWIFVGITTFSLVTALLSSEITQANSGMESKMDGARVGALRYHLYDSMVIAHYGGILADIQCTNATEGIKELMEKLRKKEIDGITLDKYMLLLFYKQFQDDPRYKDVISFMRKNTVRKGLHLPTRPYYGILAKTEEDYEFLVHFVNYNREVFNTCNGLLINQFASEEKMQQIENPLFSTSGEVFWPAFLTALVSVVFIFIFGAIYELRRNTLQCLEKAAPV